MHHAFAELNLFWNPFGEVAPQRWGELAVVDAFDLDATVARLRGVGGRFAVQLRGDAGRGKSTHMRALHAAFADRPFTYLAEDERPPRIPRADVVFVDEVQRLPPWRRRRLWRRHASFVVGTHGDHREELRVAGVTVVDVALRGLCVERLASIVDRRIESARRGPRGAARGEPGGAPGARRSPRRRSAGDHVRPLRPVPAKGRPCARSVI